MREIKFRVWDHTINKFDPEIYKAGEQFGHPSSCDWTAQQYTGLKDRNGKEICEGDIIKAQTVYYTRESLAPAGVEFLFFKLEWQDSGARWYLGQLEVGGHAWDFHSGMCEALEVVGNIFENSETKYEPIRHKYPNVAN